MKAQKLKENSYFIILFIIGVFISVVVVSLLALQSLFKQETYYVANTAIPARTEIFEEMLTPVVASAHRGYNDGDDKNDVNEDIDPWIGVEEIQRGGVFAKYPIKPGDVLTRSNTEGIQADITAGIPDEWVVTNFSVGADSTIGGRVRRGTYFDIMIINEEGAYYPFVNMLVLDTDVDSVASRTGEAVVDPNSVNAGLTATQLVVGMTPENAGKLHTVLKSGEFRLVLSPKQNAYNPPRLADYEGMFKYDRDSDGPIWSGEKDGKEVTDNTFTQVERNRFGEPCSSGGNIKFYGEDCKKYDEKQNKEKEKSATVGEKIDKAKENAENKNG